MKINDNKTAQKLFDAFHQFHHLKWRESPVKDLTSSEFHLLLAIKKRGSEEGIKVSDLSNLMKIAPPSATQLINSLEKKGYAERTTDKNDRRAVRIKLTEKADAVMVKAYDDFASSFIGLAEFLGDKKSNELADLLFMVFEYFKKIHKKNE